MSTNGVSGLPEFTTAIRGYDREQVDEYVARLLYAVDEADGRTRAAEAELEFSRHTTVGPRVSEILELAVSEAKDLREKAGREGQRARAEARAEAESILARAEEVNAAARAEIELERDQARYELEQERRRSELAVEQLADTKSALLEDLHRLQQILSAAAGIASSVQETAATPAPAVDVSEEPTVETRGPGTAYAA